MLSLNKKKKEHRDVCVFHVSLLKYNLYTVKFTPKVHSPMSFGIGIQSHNHNQNVLSS